VTPFGYWRRAWRFALGRRLPDDPADVPVWALTVPYQLWRDVVRYDGRTFEDLQSAAAPHWLRRALPLRALYLAFVLAWPLVAAARALRRGRRAGAYWRMALSYPELSVFHGWSDYTEREARWSRPDFSLAMYHAWRYRHARDPYFLLDDKRHFLDVCAREGLPLPPTLRAEEAVAKGGSYIVKDPQRDLGFGVTVLTAEELREAGDEARDVIIQERLRNHPSLLRALPETAPLCSLRVITTLDPATREPRVSRCAIRIGRAGAVADNTAQGGIWAQVDRETGEILPGVTKTTFGTWVGDEPVRFRAHPDTKRSFAGLTVPWFEAGKRMALDAHAKLAPDAVSLGWDVALAAGEPVFLEVNVWTTCYDYDPPDDALTPACALIAAGLRGSQGAGDAVASGGK
jgi:hypothetical protein